MGFSSSLYNYVQVALLLFLFFGIKFSWCSNEVLRASCKWKEREALFVFKGSLTDPSNRLLSWTGGDCCSWAGVGCDNLTGHVVKLDLPNPSFLFENYSETWLVGSEVSSALANLQQLEYLDLRYNNFAESRIPEFFGDFKCLKVLLLSHASFAGVVPQSLGNLSALQDLRLYGLDHLILDSSQWLARLTSLKYLRMGAMNLSQVPDAIHNLTNLVDLLMSDNHLSGHIPDWLSQLKNLQSLDLLDNSFSGSIPSSFCSMPNLETLNLGMNQLSGSIPSFFCSIPNLKILNLGTNQLSGSIPACLGNMTNLEMLYLDTNLLKGSIPESLGQLSNLKRLDVVNNSFSGSIPSSFCSMPNLEILDLGMNQLSGSIPACLGNVSSLNWLSMFDNDLSGDIPDWLCQLKNLQFLNFKINSISGSIPTCLGNMSSLSTLSLGINLLNGTVPESLGQLSNLKHFDVSINSLSGVVSDIHFERCSKLEHLDMGFNSLVLNMSSDWSPPFQLKVLYLKSCQFAHGFPLWFQAQKALTELSIRDVKISFDFEDFMAHFSSTLSIIDASNTSIFGRIPENFGNVMPNFTFLVLSNNNIDGSIPTSLCEMKNLQTLDLSNNHISGELPNACWSNSKDMRLIDLASNHLAGRIPSSIYHMPFLVALHLSNNEFHGELPQTLKNCKVLDFLDLAGNKFTGSLPSWIGGLSSLRILDLKSNKFGGSLIPELCQLYNLHILDISQNNFSNSIPPCFGNFNGMKQGGDMNLYWRYGENLKQVMKGRELEYTRNLKFLAKLDLSNNNLTGGIPGELTSLHGLTGLHLSNNQLTGEIPKMIGSLKSLDSLDLSNNKLSGSIPQSISALGTLSYLNVSFNDLSGKIPSGHLQSFDRSSYVGNPHLCGIPLNKDCSLQTPSQILGNTHEVEDDDEHDVGFYIGIIVGSIVGLCGFWGVLLFKKTWRFTYFRFVESTVVVVLSLVTCLKKKFKNKS